MDSSLADPFALLRRGRTMVDSAFMEARDPARRSACVAHTMRSLWPSAPLYLCVLRDGSADQAAVLNEAGCHCPEWELGLREAGILGVEKQQPPRRYSGDVAAALGIPGHDLAVEPIACCGRSWGLLGFAIPQSAQETNALARTVLATSAFQLALLFSHEELERDRRTLLQELAEQSRLADIGELAAPLSHEINNFLNSLWLQLAVLEQLIPQEWRSELADMRNQGRPMAEVVRQLQQYRRDRRSRPRPVDLNKVVLETVGAFRDEASKPGHGPRLRIHPAPPWREAGTLDPESIALILELAPGLPPVLGSPYDLRRLCTFLTENAVAVMPANGKNITLRTDASADIVCLHVEDTGPAVSADQLDCLFDADNAGRGGSNRLALAACKSLVQRLIGRIRGSNRPEGGLVISVELPVASVDQLP